MRPAAHCLLSAKRFKYSAIQLYQNIIIFFGNIKWINYLSIICVCLSNWLHWCSTSYILHHCVIYIAPWSEHLLQFQRKVFFSIQPHRYCRSRFLILRHTQYSKNQFTGCNVQCASSSAQLYIIVLLEWPRWQILSHRPLKCHNIRKKNKTVRK